MLVKTPKYSFNKTTFDEKVNYFFSKYEGDNFFKSYFFTRQNTIEKTTQYIKDKFQTLDSIDAFTYQEFTAFDIILNAAEFTPEEQITAINDQAIIKTLIPKYLSEFSISIDTQSSLDITEATAKFPTEQWLKIIILDLNKKTPFTIKNRLENIKKLSKKYDVYQKIYTQYNASFLKASEDFSNISNYALLSIICLLSAKEQKPLRYLNTALKISDFLINIDYAKLTPTELLFILVAIKNEIHLIKNLRASYGKT